MDAKREQAEKESWARILAEKALFEEREKQVYKQLEPHQEEATVIKGRVAPYDEETKVSKKTRAKVDTMKKLYGF
jgi:hypothetical protein